MPRVSVNIPCYNGEKYIAEALQSVLDQTYQDFEVILVNDGSTDRTEEIIKGFCDERIKYYYQENIGLARTRNRQLELSNGEFVAFLDQDDLWLPAKLEKQIPLFEQNPKVGLVYSKTIYFNDKNDCCYLSKTKKHHAGYIFGELLKGNFISVQSAVIRKNALDNLNQWFDEQFNIVEDADLFLRIAYYYEVGYVDIPLAKRRMHKNSLSFNRNDLYYKERRIFIDKLKKLYPNITEKFSCELKLMESEMFYNEALICWANGKRQKARQLIKPFLRFNKKLLFPFMLSYILTHRLYILTLRLFGKSVHVT